MSLPPPPTVCRPAVAPASKGGRAVNVVRSSTPFTWKTLVALVSVLALVGTGCSKNRVTAGGGGAPLTKVFVQKFRYHGMPTHLPPGLHQFLFQNEEAF